MADTFSDTLILDPARFNPETRRWNVPILLIRGVEVEELNIGGSVVSVGNYSVKGNHLVLNETFEIKDGTKAFLIVKYNTTDIRVKFWLPIIIAFIGLIGTAIQPILYKADIIYQPPLNIEPRMWAYNTQANKFSVTMVAENLSKSDKKKWKIFVAVREKDDSVAPREASYHFITGPIDLDSLMNVEVATDNAFNAKVLERRSYVQGVIFKVKKGIEITGRFTPKNFPEKDVVYVAGPANRARPQETPPD